jgi:predicted phage terminase large subunit-like protein
MPKPSIESSRPDFSAAIDFSLPFPNLRGTPLWMLPETFSDDVRLAVADMHARVRAFRHLAEFSVRHVGVTPALHHRYICEAIDALMSDEFDVLVVMAPPASAKSTYVSISAPSYIIGRDPSTRIISVSRSADMATEFGGRVRNIVETPLFHNDTGVEIAADTRAKDNWKTTAGGGYFAVGAAGGVLGKRADVVLVDDLHTSFEDAQSETQLAKLHKWFESDLLSRLTPTGKLVVIGQRLNANDIIGFVIARQKKNPDIRMRVLKFEAECTDPVNDCLGRTEVGQRMWPEFYTEAYLKDKKADNFIWRTLWQQEPPSETGSWASTDDFRFAPTPEYDKDSYNYYGLTDLALSVNTGDYTVHAIIAAHKQTQHCHIVDLYRRRVDPDASADALVGLAGTYKPVEWLIDDDNASKVFMQLVATRARSENTLVKWRPMPMRGQNKETRAAGLRGMFKRGMVYFDPAKPFSNVVINECLQFPNAMGQGVDDIVDALSLLGRRLTALTVVKPQAARPPQPTRQDMTLNQLWADQPRRSTRI